MRRGREGELFWCNLVWHTAAAAHATRVANQFLAGLQIDGRRRRQVGVSVAQEEDIWGSVEGRREAGAPQAA